MWYLQWLPEVTHFCEGVPKLLIGTKIDLRDNQARIAQLNALGSQLITYEQVNNECSLQCYISMKTVLTMKPQGERLAKEIGAKYHECSAMLNKNVNEVIEAATRAAMSGGIMKLQKKLCTLL